MSSDHHTKFVLDKETNQKVQVHKKDKNQKRMKE